MSSYLQAEAREENLVDLKDLQLSGRFRKTDPDGKRLREKSFQCGFAPEAKKAGQGNSNSRKKWCWSVALMMAFCAQRELF